MPSYKISREVKGEKKMTKTVLIVAAAAVFMLEISWHGYTNTV